MVEKLAPKMREIFNTPLIRKIREETRVRSAYADSHLAPGMKDLMDKTRNLFGLRAVDISEGASAEEIDKIFDECVDQIPGAKKAFETWTKLFENARLN